MMLSTFFRPDHRHLHDPFLMQDMEKAIERIEEAIRNNEKVLIYGDYDVDGTTAVSVVYGFFKKSITITWSLLYFPTGIKKVTAFPPRELTMLPSIATP